MEELSIEEKARAYDEAKARMRRVFNSNRCTIGFMNEIFPEINGSEDDRIREDLIQWIDDFPDSIWRGHYKKDILAWLEKHDANKEYVFRPLADTMIENAVEQALEQGDVVLAFNGFYTPVKGKTSEEILTEYDNWIEKQCEQPTDKVEPKFKVGDWVILNGIVAKILDKQKYGFVGLDIDGKNFFCNYGHTDSMRLWSINDAKDGDVLLEEEIGEPFIYNGNRAIHFLGVHCGIYNGEFNPYGGIHHCGKNSHPATKEQRDLLFQKMKEAEYEWDDEKKELKKIEDKTLDADKVIKWIDEHVPTKFEDMENYVKDFKQDFGLC